MKTTRSTLLAVTTVLLVGAGTQVIAACSDDDSAPASPGTDAGSSGNTAEASSPVDAGTTAPPGPVFTVSEVRSKIYLGQSVVIDGAKIGGDLAGATVAWRLLSAPAESVAKLEGATSPSPAFKPDVLGPYAFELVASKAGSARTFLVFVDALDAPVFYRTFQVRMEDGGAGAALASAGVSTRVSGVHGKADRTVGCPVELTNDSGAPDFAYFGLVYAARLSASAGDTWEGPPGTPARVVFADALFAPAGDTAQLSLSVATSTSPCGAPEARQLDSQSAAGAELATVFRSARFSADGSRIAYLRYEEGNARVVSIGFDGSSLHIIAPASGTPDGGLAGGAPTPSPQAPAWVRWADKTHIAWTRFVGESAESENPHSWELYIVEDATGATPSVHMRCEGLGLSSFDLLPDGKVVASVRRGLDGGNGALDLVVLKPNATTRACEEVTKLTNGAGPTAVARDFALSPDKTKIAFFLGEGDGKAPSPTSSLSLALVPVDGSSPPLRVAGAPAGGADPGIGPRWVAGGTALTWGQKVPGGQPDGIQVFAGQVVAIEATGGTLKPVSALPFSYGIGQGCALGTGVRTGCGGATFVGLGLALALARRRRASRRAVSTLR